MAQKSQLIKAIQFASDETMAFAGKLSEEQRSTSGQVDRWSERDVLAHLAYSNRQMAETLTSGQRGETPPEGLSNEDAYFLYQDRSWESILDELRQGYDSLVGQVQALTEEELNTPLEWLNGRPIWRAVAGTVILHSIIHVAQALIEQGQGEQALRLDELAQPIAGQLDGSPDWQGMFLYNTGCYYALMGNKPLALKNLESGFRLSTRMVEFSKDDSDLVSLQGDADFQALQDRFSAAG